MQVPVRWWHGDADSIAHLPDAELILMPDESHLGSFAAPDEVLGFVRSFP